MRSRSFRWPHVALLLAAVPALGWMTPPAVWDRFIPPTDAVKEAGRELFVRQWSAGDSVAQGDGLGPVFNARSCADCHFQGGVGGGGDIAHNVTAFQVHPNVRDRKPQAGLVHRFAIDKTFLKSQTLLRNRFPVIPGGDRVVGGCTVKFEDFDPVSIQSINSTALFGAGLIDRMSESAIRLHHARRVVGKLGSEIAGDFRGVSPGRQRALPSGRLGRFGWKGQFARLEEFVAAACANELGLGNPLMEQAQPLGKDYKSDKPDLTREQFRQLVAFVAALPRPEEVTPSDHRQRKLAEHGKELFTSIGCAECHTPNIGNVSGIYSDLMLHSLSSKQGDGYTHEIIVEVPLPEDHPAADEWRTPPLWGVADSAPYFHDGNSPTLQAAIERHEGDAARVTKAFRNLVRSEQQAIIAFLQTLRAPASARSAESLLAAQASPGRR